MFRVSSRLSSGDALVSATDATSAQSGKRHETAARPVCREKRAKYASSFALLNHSTSTDCLSYPRLREEKKMDSHHAHNEFVVYANVSPLPPSRSIIDDSRAYSANI